MKTRGPSITVADIGDFEAQHGIKLPSSYAEFLLECNGGVPEASLYSARGGYIVYISRLFRLSKIRDESIYVTPQMKDGWLPIGDNGGGDYLMLDISTGAVHLWLHELDDEGGEQPMKYLEPSIQDLLMRARIY